MEYFLIFISAIFVNNIVLSQFLGICPFLGVSKKINTAAGMGVAVTFVLTVAVIVTYALQNWVLNPLALGYLQTIVFILVIAGLVQMLEMILKKVSPSLYQALTMIKQLMQRAQPQNHLQQNMNVELVIMMIIIIKLKTQLILFVIIQII